MRACLALVSCENLFWSWLESILNICCQKLGFHQRQDLCLSWHFLIFRKNGQLWGTLVIKPLDLHGLIGYHMKDNIHIFHLVPCKPVSDHWNYHKKVQEKVAWSSEHQKVDISPVLSYSTTGRTKKCCVGYQEHQNRTAEARFSPFLSILSLSITKAILTLRGLIWFWYF